MAPADGLPAEKASKEPPEAPIDVLNSNPRPRPPLKPELDDYISLNFIGGAKGLSAVSGASMPGGHEDDQDGGGGGGDGGGGRSRTSGDSSGEDDDTRAEETLWRCSGSPSARTPLPRGASDNGNRPATQRGEGGGGGGGGGAPREGSDSAAATAGCAPADGDDEGRLYPRTLGSSVSVLDEKDAVLRTGGARFAGEDPVRGRLRATDPFLWMGRLNAGTRAISGLIDKANGALGDLESGSDSDSVASAGGVRRRFQTMDEVKGALIAGKEVISSPSSGGRSVGRQAGKRGRGQESTTGKRRVRQLGDLGDFGSTEVEGDDDGEEEREGSSGHGATDRDDGFVSSSGGGNATVEQLSSTMSAYSQAVETNRVLAGGVVLEEAEDEDEDDSEEEKPVSQPTNARGYRTSNYTASLSPLPIPRRAFSAVSCSTGAVPFSMT